MKRFNRKHSKGKYLIAFLIYNLLFLTTIYAQEVVYWQGISVKNPAAIGTPSDWIFGNYLFTNLNKLTSGDEKGPTGWAMGADYQISPETGSVGMTYTNTQMGKEKANQLEMSYAYSFPFENGILNGGLSFGLQK